MSVHALALASAHNFTKTPVSSFILLTGLGVQGDCHSGVLHLIPKEILDECGVEPGQIGENVTTTGVDLLALGKGTRLHFLPSPSSPYSAPASSRPLGDDNEDENGDEDETGMWAPHAVVVIQGLRNPCPQIDKFREGLKERLVVRDEARRIVGRRAGVMGTVEVGGMVTVGMTIVVERAGVFEELKCV
ncbi:hypothetical protein NEMBOFW57_010602 [Staphylotrichum longicolle]|uniref:MOSC domain-containing protein n=1 Tax=Staphylotrichum longicolle TaxID=669026 RepID=A0AAD4HX52_9PEZI|nr:hypothetical protein NEMBOFW57_010602 [Staphylotrichum longicolle]